MSKKTKIIIVGDSSDWNNPDFSQIPNTIVNKIKKSDLFIFNLEGPVCDNTINNKYAPYNFLTKRIAKFFKKIQPRVINSSSLFEKLPLGKNNLACLANNHIKDGGAMAFNNTLNELKKKKIGVVGAGRNLKKARKVYKTKINNKKIAVINSNYVGWYLFGRYFNIFGAKTFFYGANYISWRFLNKEIDSLKKDGYFVISILHAGQEMKDVNDQMKTRLKSLISDITVLHHQHFAEELNIENVYTTGDFIFKAKHLPDKRKSKVLEFYI